jgi:hypothetical protein
MEEHNKRQNLLIEFQIKQARREDIRRQEAMEAQRQFNSQLVQQQQEQAKVASSMMELMKMVLKKMDK